MKKITSLLLVIVLAISLVALTGCFDTPPHEHKFVEGKCECGETDPNYVPPHEHNFVEGKCECGETDPNYNPDKVMTWEEYDAAELDAPVIVEAYVQATQSWWDNKITVYLQDEDGGYFAYEMTCTEEDAARLVPGTKIRITGYKAEWAGEVEIVDCTFEFCEDGETYIAKPLDVTSLLGTDDLIKHQNMLVLFKRMTVKSIEYKNGERGDDIYVILTKNGVDYSFCVERYLTGPDSELYLAVEALNAGDIVNVEGFLYWYNGINTHMTRVRKTDKSEGVMTWEEYDAAELDATVVIEAYVQGHQSWWDNKITVYLQDEDGGYFAYEMTCTEEDASKLVPGTKIKITGYKAEWSGEIEIVDCTFEFCNDGKTYIAEPLDVTALLGAEELITHQNMLVAFKGMTVKSISYKNGEPGDDIYVTFTKNGVDYDFCVERYLTGPNTAIYQAVGDLQTGDIVDVEGFLYWYNGVNTHMTKVTKTGGVNTKSEGVMTWAEYDAAELDASVVVEAYVQGHQSWWDNKITVYLQDGDGGYFAYEMTCTEEDAAKLVPGTKIKITGYKAAWADEVEIVDCTFEFCNDGTAYIAEPIDVTALLGSDDLIKHQNKLVVFKDMTFKSLSYKGGERGDDIYVTFTKDGVDYDFCVERYLTGPDSDVYKAIEALEAGDVVDVEGFLYWYNGMNPHITGVK